MKSSITKLMIGLLVLAVTVALAVPAMAQPGRRPPYPPPPPRHHHHHGPSDFDKALGVIGAVGVVAAIANGHSSYDYYRRSRPVVVVPPPRTVVVEQPVVVERPVVIEKQVVVERTVPGPVTLPNDYYSPKLGATFKIQNMQIPGYRFTAARLTSDPLEGSPLAAIGLVKGDVVTRLNDTPINRLETLEMHEKATLVRYIKTGTVKVQMARIYIPTDAELAPIDEGGYYAP